MNHPPERLRRHSHEHDQLREGGATVEPARDELPNYARLAGQLGAIQMFSSSRLVVNDPDAMKDSAASGIAGSGRQLPHLDRIQASFGSNHDLTGVRAHVGGDAAVASQELGAEGYATGNDVAFAKEPDLRLAAHEAAHVVQQREGVSLKSGIGEAGDAHEQAADAVADRVVRGKPADDLLPAGTATAASRDGGVQRYEERKLDGRRKWRVSESGKSAVKQDGMLQTLFATRDLIDAANALLLSAGEKGSFVFLIALSETMQVGENQLHQVMPEIYPLGLDTGSEAVRNANHPGVEDSDGLTLADTNNRGATWSDCSRMAGAVMGTSRYGEGWETGEGPRPRAHYRKDGEGRRTTKGWNTGEHSDNVYLDVMPAFLADPAHVRYLKEDVHFRELPSKVIEPMNPDQARAQYCELREGGQRAFDQYAGINTGANPEVGGAYMMNTEDRMPGFAPVLDDQGRPRRPWNYHWAGVIMKDGENNISLENYAMDLSKEEPDEALRDQKQRDWINRDWNYQMYGSVKEGQTFHEEHLKTGTHGTQASSFTMKADD